jgi:hypothetical protein
MCRLPEFAIVATLLLAFTACAEDTVKPEPKKEEKKTEIKADSKDGYTEAVVGCAKCAFAMTDKCAPAIKIGQVVYLIKLDDKLDDKTKDLLTKASGTKETIKVKVKGSTAEENGKQSYYHVGELLIEN